MIMICLFLIGWVMLNGKMVLKSNRPVVYVCVCGERARDLGNDKKLLLS